MSATRRGYAVCAVCVLALVAGSVYGARALNAIVVPGLVALCVGWISVRRTRPPTVTRSRPAPGFPGETRTVGLDVDAERPTTATVSDRVGDGLSAGRAATSITLPGRIEYECRYDRRGEHALGPATITVTDALSLFRREFRAAATTDVLVYPTVRSLSRGARPFLSVGSGDVSVGDRDEFDSLREYVPGDPLRDVHWKSSAKRDSYVVTEFVSNDDETTFSIVAEAAPDTADEMATAAASVACWLLDAGVEIELTTPDARLSGAEATRERVLETLARANAGRVATRRKERGDIVIAAESREPNEPGEPNESREPNEPNGEVLVTVSVGESTESFDRLVGARSPTATPRSSATELDPLGRTEAVTDGGLEPEAAS